MHFSRRSKSGACSLRFKCSSVFDYKHQDCREGIDLRHQGGATCKFLRHFTVALVCTKKSKFHLAEPTKTNNLNQFMMQKCTNENAARFPPLLSTVVSLKDIDFWRFLVALVDLSEPDPQSPGTTFQSLGTTFRHSTKASCLGY